MECCDDGLKTKKLLARLRYQGGASVGEQRGLTAQTLFR
jgi:hypothetical protein